MFHSCFSLFNLQGTHCFPSRVSLSTIPNFKAFVKNFFLSSADFFRLACATACLYYHSAPPLSSYFFTFFKVFSTSLWRTRSALIIINNVYCMTSVSFQLFVAFFTSDGTLLVVFSVFLRKVYIFLKNELTFTLHMSKMWISFS